MRVIKISLAILVVLVILLGLLVVLMWDWGPEVPFDFLDGRALTRTKREPITSVYGHTIMIYSFDGDFADFKDVCTKANSELLAMDFNHLPPMGDVLHSQVYLSSSTTPSPCVFVGLFYRREIEAHSTANSSEHPPPNRYTSQDKIGSISVSVVRAQSTSWWPRRLLYRLQVMLRRNANSPPPKKS